MIPAWSLHLQVVIHINRKLDEHDNWITQARYATKSIKIKVVIDLESQLASKPGDNALLSSCLAPFAFVAFKDRPIYSPWKAHSSIQVD